MRSGRSGTTESASAAQGGGGDNCRRDTSMAASVRVLALECTQPSRERLSAPGYELGQATDDIPGSGSDSGRIIITVSIAVNVMGIECIGDADAGHPQALAQLFRCVCTDREEVSTACMLDPVVGDGISHMVTGFVRNRESREAVGMVTLSWYMDTSVCVSVHECQSVGAYLIWVW